VPGRVASEALGVVVGDFLRLLRHGLGQVYI
jgi:hypothetical protein